MNRLKNVSIGCGFFLTERMALLCLKQNKLAVFYNLMPSEKFTADNVSWRFQIQPINFTPSGNFFFHNVMLSQDSLQHQFFVRNLFTYTLLKSAEN